MRHLHFCNLHFHCSSFSRAARCSLLSLFRVSTVDLVVPLVKLCRPMFTTFDILNCAWYDVLNTFFMLYSCNLRSNSARPVKHSSLHSALISIYQSFAWELLVCVVTSSSLSPALNRHKTARLRLRRSLNNSKINRKNILTKFSKYQQQKKTIKLGAIKRILQLLEVARKLRKWTFFYISNFFLIQY